MTVRAIERCSPQNAYGQTTFVDDPIARLARGRGLRRRGRTARPLPVRRRSGVDELERQDAVSGLMITLMLRASPRSSGARNVASSTPIPARVTSRSTRSLDRRTSRARRALRGRATRDPRSCRASPARPVMSTLASPPSTRTSSAPRPSSVTSTGRSSSLGSSGPDNANVVSVGRSPGTAACTHWRHVGRRLERLALVEQHDLDAHHLTRGGRGEREDRPRARLASLLPRDRDRLRCRLFGPHVTADDDLELDRRTRRFWQCRRCFVGRDVALLGDRDADGQGEVPLRRQDRLDHGLAVQHTSDEPPGLRQASPLLRLLPLPPPAQPRARRPGVGRPSPAAG